MNYLKMNHIEEDILTNSKEKTWTRIDCMWTSPPPALTIENGEVHVWCIHLNMPHIQIQQMETILSDDELVKANRFHFDKHRRCYIASHGMLRKILSRYIYLNPSQIQFNYSPLGKPTLAFGGNHVPLSFNLSHSNQLALIAVALNRSIGIDIEFMRFNTDLESIAEQYFSPSEYETIKSFSPYQRHSSIFDLWTLKEAYLKATGEGIGGLDQIEFSLSPYKSPQVIINKKNSSATSWTIRQMIPLAGYTAGLAVEGNSSYVFRYYKS